MKTVNVTVFTLVGAMALITYTLTTTIANVTKQLELDENYAWIRHIILNICSYSSVLAPGLLFYFIVNRIHVKRSLKLTEQNVKEAYYEDNAYYLLKTYQFCFGHKNDDVETNRAMLDGEHRIKIPSATKNRAIKVHKHLLLIACALGLQLFYLVWGILQEKIMTTNYTSGEKSERFRDSQFLVFVNRILAFTISGTYLLLANGVTNLNNVAFSRFVYCSLSNITSSWCQYEALKFVSFPMQVLAKASKVVPVMVMNRIMAGTKFDKFEYSLAGLMSVGLTLFILATSNHQMDHVTTASGIVLMSFYIIFDSFTSNYQGELFKKHSITPVQMTFGVNFFSCMFTFMSMLQQGELAPSIAFVCQFPTFLIDIVILSICSAFGQLLIFFTISTFGAVTFTVIMTTRQAFAVLLSCVIYNHNVSGLGVFGICLVFFSMFLRVYYNNRKRRRALITNL